jgi:hypothetical protein
MVPFSAVSPLDGAEGQVWVRRSILRILQVNAQLPF